MSLVRSTGSCDPPQGSASPGQLVHGVPATWLHPHLCCKYRTGSSSGSLSLLESDPESPSELGGVSKCSTEPSMKLKKIKLNKI